VAKEKSKEPPGSFTVGSATSGAKARPAAPKAGKAHKKITVDIKESSFPILASLRRGGGKDAKALQAEMQRVLLEASEVAKTGSEKEKKDAEQVQKAYALSLALLENGKIVR
jgi:hypothetical protein